MEGSTSADLDLERHLSNAPSSAALPQQPEEITPQWLTAALAETMPEARVDAVEVAAIQQGTNANARLRVTWSSPAGAPDTLFLKLPPLDAKRRASVNATGMGRREALFYQTLADRVPMRVPRRYVARFDEATSDFVLVLEDLEASACRLPDPVEGLSPAQAHLAMDDFAQLHVRYEDEATRAREAGWVEPMPPGNAYGSSMLGYALEHHRDLLTDAFAELAVLYVEQQAAYEAAWARGPQTVIQGDGHIGNLFLDGDRPGFFDWGLIQLGTPMREVGYFIALALSPEHRRRHERELIAHYLEARTAAGGSAISFDDAWLDHRLVASYAVPASCSIVLFPGGRRPPRDGLSGAFLDRAESVIEDLGAREALREATGL